jgi:hypothetical protein
MKWHPITLIVIALLLGMSLPAKAQQTECLEFYSYDQNIRHRVDPDTGAMTSFEYKAPSYLDALLNSPDGRYSLYLMEPGGLELPMIDHETETVIVLSENAHSAAWSPDGAWLAYIETEANEETKPELVLYNLKTEERQQHDFEAPIGSWSNTRLLWSPNGTQIALRVIENIDTQYSHLSLFSVPDLTLQHNFDASLFAAEITWSPSGQFLIVSSRAVGEILLIDTRDGQIANTLLTRDVGYYFIWSPTEEFLVVYLTVGDFANQLIVLNQRGEHLIDDLYVPASQYDVLIAHAWLSDYQLLVEVWDNGFDNLMLIDLQTGERQILQENVGGYALSSDQQTVAFEVLDVRDPSKHPMEIRFFDLIQDDPAPLKSLPLDTPAGQFLWRVDRDALIVLFEDYSLQEYDFETKAWRLIASIPDDQRWSMRWVACAE